MRHHCIAVCGLVLAAGVPASASLGSSQPARDARAKTTYAGLFKNGLALVRQEPRVPESGVFRIDPVPLPVHGTWWVDSEARVVARVVEREVERSVAPTDLWALQRSLVGTEVEVVLKGQTSTPVRGRVESFQDDGAVRSWNRAYEQPAYHCWFVLPRLDSATKPPPAARYLVLKTADDRLRFIETSMVAVLTTLGPSVRLDPVNVRQAGSRGPVIKNELTDLDGVEIELISGFPKRRFLSSRLARQPRHELGHLLPAAARADPPCPCPDFQCHDAAGPALISRPS
jgi:hypothetical protein